jgi:hypothetical protein
VPAPAEPLPALEPQPPVRPLSFLLLPNSLPVPHAPSAQPEQQRLLPPPVLARSQESSSWSIPAVPPQPEASPQPRFPEHAPLTVARPWESWLNSPPQSAASPPPDPPADAMQSQGSAAVLPQCSEPGAAMEQSVSAQASPLSLLAWSQQARLSVVSSPPRSSPPYSARAHLQQAIEAPA